MNVVIYARFSSHSQREQSIEGQLHDCYDYATRYGLNVVGEYIDRAISGTTDDRPDFQRMIADAAKHQFERIIVWKLDRFARNRYDSALYKHKLKQHGVRVISAMENVGEGDESILLEALLEASAEYYSMDLRKKIKRGQRENIAKGLYCGGSVAFGYKAENGKLVPDEKTAPIIRHVFDLYASGVQMKEIVKEMRSRGVKTQRGGEVTHSTFTRALTNTVYIGKYMYKGQEIPGMAAPIIDEAVFYRAAERLKSNKRATVTERTKVEYLLHGKAFCGKCGGHMIGASGTSKTGDKHYYYACIGRRKKMGCTKANEKKDFIEWYVVEQTLQYVLAPERLRYIAKAVVEEYKKEFGATQEEELVKAIKRYDREMEKLVDAIVEAPKAAHKKIYEKIESVEKQKAALESDLTKLRLASSIRFTESEVAAWLMQFCKGDLLDMEFRRKIIDVFINSIYLYDDRIIIFYNIKGGKQVTYMDVVESTEPPSDSSTVDALPPPKTYAALNTMLRIFLFNMMLSVKNIYIQSLTIAKVVCVIYCFCREGCLMKYVNGKDILPPHLLRQIQSYVSGKLVYIPTAEKRGWGEESGYRRCLAERNRDIRQEHAQGVSVEILAETFGLSEESIRRIVYTQKEDFIMDYACTLRNAQQAAETGELEKWIHTYLLTDGNNKPFSDGLKKLERIFHAPVSFPLSLLERNTGPEPEMRWKIHPGWFEQHVEKLKNAIKDGADLPPLIVHYLIPEGESVGEFEMNDGNHRLEAFKRLGMERYHVIFWCTEKHEYDQLMERFGDLMV